MLPPSPGHPGPDFPLKEIAGASPKVRETVHRDVGLKAKGLATVETGADAFFDRQSELRRTLLRQFTDGCAFPLGLLRPPREQIDHCSVEFVEIQVRLHMHQSFP
jgi:hypothetical protein